MKERLKRLQSENAKECSPENGDSNPPKVKKPLNSFMTNDKIVVSVAVTILAIGALIALGPKAENILLMTIGGLLGFASGQQIGKVKCD